MEWIKYTVCLHSAPCSSLDGVTACVVYTADSIRKFDSKSNRTADSIPDLIRTQKTIRRSLHCGHTHVANRVVIGALVDACVLITEQSVCLCHCDWLCCCCPQSVAVTVIIAGWRCILPSSSLPSKHTTHSNCRLSIFSAPGIDFFSCLFLVYVLFWFVGCLVLFRQLFYVIMCVLHRHYALGRGVREVSHTLSSEVHW